MRKSTNNLIRQAMGDVVAQAMVGQTTKEMTFRYSDVDASERKKAHEAAFGDAFSGNYANGATCDVAPVPLGEPGATR
jgi:hypothetical protein